MGVAGGCPACVSMLHGTCRPSRQRAARARSADPRAPLSAPRELRERLRPRRSGRHELSSEWHAAAIAPRGRLSGGARAPARGEIGRQGVLIGRGPTADRQARTGPRHPCDERSGSECPSDHRSVSSSLKSSRQIQHFTPAAVSLRAQRTRKAPVQHDGPLFERWACLRRRRVRPGTRLALRSVGTLGRERVHVSQNPHPTGDSDERSTSVGLFTNLSLNASTSCRPCK